jgi:hypothetical protein
MPSRHRSVGRALHGFPADGGRAGQLTDAALFSLAVLTGLTDLRLAGQARLSCRGLRALRPLSGLTNLDLQACSWGVVTEGVSQLRQFPRLSSLDLSGAPDDIVSLPGQVRPASKTNAGLHLNEGARASKESNIVDVWEGKKLRTSIRTVLIYPL